MDVVTDLTSEAITYITLLQDLHRTHEDRPLSPGKNIFELWDKPYSLASFSEKNIERIKEIIFVSKNTDKSLITSTAVGEYFLEAAYKLTLWLGEHKIGKQFDGGIVQDNAGASPSYWREKIRIKLYYEPESRLNLSMCLNYIPLLVVYALNGKQIKDLYKQRLFQVYYNTDTWGLNILSQKDEPHWLKWRKRKVEDVKQGKLSWKLIVKKYNDFRSKWKKGALTSKVEDKLSREELIKKLLTDDKVLLERLKTYNIPLPFETLFPKELDEIEESRKLRGTNSDTKEQKDPFTRASEMKMHGLAFSGGGIRSATFNLGILQKLAALGVLKDFDYISMVSGGGYIGSWYISWLQRSGDINKVHDRLNPAVSNDPLAEEVRPIRWLRMYSNYLTPLSSIMSADSWTVGVTWLRNILINQLVLLLLFVCVLSGIDSLFEGWKFIDKNATDEIWQVIIYVSFLVFIVSITFFAGSGIRVHEAPIREKKWLINNSRLLPHFIIVSALLMAFVGAAWLSGKPFTAKFDSNTLRLFGWIVLPGLASIFIIAVLGRYFKMPLKPNFGLAMAILFSSILAAFFGGGLLALVWYLTSKIGDINTVLEHWKIITKNRTDELQFIFGLPMVIEVMSLTVIIRMWFMGIYFPDSRREWWGRMGGLIHRFILIWTLCTVGALLIPDIFNSSKFSNEATTLSFVTGGWTAVILAAVKMAFDSNGESDSKKKGYIIKEIFIRFAPYLFMLGFLLIAATMLTAFIGILPQGYLNKLLWDGFLSKDKKLLFLHAFVRTIGLAIITFILAQRAGVNEFSLHHFYKNRLVRAYLGATRRRISRDISANRFTGFDSKDDIKLADFKADKKYDGPYPIINTALNATSVTDLDRQDRKAESFVFSPLYCGFDFSPTRSAGYSHSDAYEYAYRSTEEFSMEGGPSLGTAMAISGAAANPNMGYHSSSATAFMLTMFNVRLGWWIGNPRLDAWKRSEPRTGLIYLIKDLMGRSSVNTDYVCLSDGGHFDNMGIYELVRRRCSYILLCDAEQDENGICEGLANAVRRCRIDFGVEINLDVSGILNLDKKTGYAAQHLKQGTIIYPDGKKGKIIYVKTSLRKPESADLREYSKRNPLFPQQSTADQFYDEAQFESYRKLGFESIQTLAEIGM